MPLDAMTLPERATPLMAPGAVSKILFPVVERGLSWTTKAGDPVVFTTHKGLVRSELDNGSFVPRVLSVVNSTYKLVTNKELFTSVEKTMTEIVPSKQLEGVILKDHIAYDGRVCYREYVFPNIRCDIGAKSDLGFRLILSNAYGGGAVKMLAGAIEFYCTNGVVTGQFESTYARHSSGLQVNRFDGHIIAALKRFVSDAETWKRWVETPVSFTSAIELFRHLGNTETLTHKLQNQCAEELEVRGANLWSIYSAMTYYSSHNEGSFALRSSTAERAGAAIMFKREMDVQSWIKTPAFKQLESV
jgi:hypothetical protein